MAASDSDDVDSGGLVARARQGDNAAPLTVTELSQKLKRTVEDRFGFVRLRGELSGVKRAASGHLYCCLKDENAVLDGVMWRGGARRLSFLPEDGIEVVASGKLTTYPGRSKYQIVIETMEIAGEGALLALLEKTRQRLGAEGLFDESRKRALPFLPRVIGVVTSPTGAVIRDILHRLADRFPSHVLVWPVLVQGQGAAEQVAAAVRGFGAIPEGGPELGGVPRPDLLIVARGGGSIEDLWSFNEEAVVRAVAASPIPVISAVGHETDTTLCDFAADRRAPTPTAAAEMAVPVRAELAATLADLRARQQRAILRPVQLGRERLEVRARRLPAPQALLQPQAQRLDDLSERLRRALGDRAARGRERLGALRLAPATLERAARDARDALARVRLAPALLTQRLGRDAERLGGTGRLLASLDPTAPIKRGFVLVRDSEGRLVRDRATAAAQARLELAFADGALAVMPADSPSGSGPVKPASAKTEPVRAKRKPEGTPPRQDDLFG
ncbi:exodeoxyribonuclease VII large subunit [Altererythrobacter sp. H2]|uniref:exodeoxyribonuclease VII large subunit n=1 Tax=Altererythrobacter sp. H2 TaxID=3108391 RepID=UPI002B4BF3A0|nr:exodeoxyribonuclease VII large subunit [Altererythrobacter sp. H2]WRK96112.1 exodeoxyribonuclease VII large subunit [Altererythrobacter sp. H2]